MKFTISLFKEKNGGRGWRLLPSHSLTFCWESGALLMGAPPTYAPGSRTVAQFYLRCFQTPSLRRADVGLFLVFGLIVLFGFYFLIIVLHNEKIWSPSASHIAVFAIPQGLTDVGWGGKQWAISHMICLGAPYPGTWGCLRKGRWAEIRIVPMLVL